MTTQLGIIVNTLWGTLVFKEITSTRGKILIAAGVSFRDYIDGQGFIHTEPVLSQFKSKEEYKKFVYDQADYQQKLEIIKHLALE